MKSLSRLLILVALSLLATSVVTKAWRDEYMDSDDNGTSEEEESVDESSEDDGGVSPSSDTDESDDFTRDYRSTGLRWSGRDERSVMNRSKRRSRYRDERRSHYRDARQLMPRPGY